MEEKGPELCWYHKRVSGKFLIAEYYGRHYCPSCKRCDIVAMCAECKRNYDQYIAARGNYDWACESCGQIMERRVVGKVSSE